MVSIKVKGYLYGALAAASYGVNPLFGLPLYSREGMGPDSVLFYRYGLAVVMLAVVMAVRRVPFAVAPRQVLPLVGLGMLFALSSLLLFDSYNYMDAGIASTLLFVYPVLVAVIMAVCFQERVSALTVVSIVLATVGIGLLYKGEGGQTLSLTGVVMVFLSSLSYAVYMAAVNRSSLGRLPAVRLTFYSLLFGMGLFFVRLDFGAAVPLIQHPLMWVDVCCLAFFPTVVSLVAMAKAIQYIGSTPTAILGALEPVTALFFGVTVFGERLSPRIVLGVVLVLVAVTLIIAARPLTDLFCRKVVGGRKRASHL